MSRAAKVKRKGPILTPARATVIAAVITAAAGMTIAVVTSVQRDRPTQPNTPLGEFSGRILSPRQNSDVSNPFLVGGTLEGIPGDHYVWFATLGDDSLWPHMANIRREERNWTTEVMELGIEPGEKFTLALLLVDGKTNEEFREWVNRGNATGEWPGIPNPLSARILDRVTLTMSGAHSLTVRLSVAGKNVVRAYPLEVSGYPIDVEIRMRGEGRGYYVHLFHKENVAGGAPYYYDGHVSFFDNTSSRLQIWLGDSARGVGIPYEVVAIVDRTASYESHPTVYLELPEAPDAAITMTRVE